MNSELISRLWERAPIGLCLVDSDFTYRWVNDTMARLLGYEPTDMIGLSFVDVTHPDDLELDVELSSQAFSGEIPYFRARKRYVRADGSIMVGDLLATVMFDADGTPDGGLAVLVDAGESDPVTRHIEHLQRSAAVGQLTAGFAHDLRNNLCVLRSVEHMLRGNVDRERALDLLAATTDSTSEVVDSLLDYATPGEGQPTLHSLPELMAASLPMLRLVVPASTTLVVGDLPTVEVGMDRGEFQQVVLNLVLNARDAIVGDNGRIEISTAPVPNDDRCLDVVVTDNGKGMSTHEIDQVFAPYFTTKGANGTGLGLSISREIVGRNGGEILVESTIDEGSRFAVRLPIAQNSSVQSRAFQTVAARPVPSVSV